MRKKMLTFTIEILKHSEYCSPRANTFENKQNVKFLEKT